MVGKTELTETEHPTRSQADPSILVHCRARSNNFVRNHALVTSAMRLPKKMEATSDDSIGGHIPNPVFRRCTWRTDEAQLSKSMPTGGASESSRKSWLTSKVSIFVHAAADGEHIHATKLWKKLASRLFTRKRMSFGMDRAG